MTVLQARKKRGGLILAGGASRRMGADKALLDWAGATALERVWSVAEALCGGSVLVCGGDYGRPFVPDPQPRAGPVAGLLAGAAALKARGCDSLLVLAVDAPTLTLADLQPLLAAASPGAVYDSFPLPMCLDLVALPADAEGGWPLRRLVERAGLKVLDCSADLAARVRGANNMQERAGLLANSHFE